MHDETEQGARQLYIELMKKALTASIYEESAWTKVLPSDLLWRPFHKPFNRIFKNLLIALLSRHSMLMVKARPYEASSRECGVDWPLFGFTMTGHRRLDNIQKCLESVLEDGVPGDFIETGAWRGGATIFMRSLLKVYGVSDRKVWVADSFDGMPIPKDKEDGWDLSKINQLKVSLAQVKSNFERFGLLDGQVEFLQGWFCETLPKAGIKELAILRMDGDLYSSTMDSLRNLYHKVNKGRIRYSG